MYTVWVKRAGVVRSFDIPAPRTVPEQVSLLLGATSGRRLLVAKLNSMSSNGLHWLVL